MSQILLSAFLFAFSLSVLIFRIIFRKKNQLEKRLKEVTTTPVQAKRQEEDILNKPFFERVVRPIISFISKFVLRFSPSKGRQKLQQSLQQAGNPANLKPHEFQAIQILAVVLAVLLVGILTGLTHKKVSDQITLIMLTVMSIVVLSKIYINRRIRTRKTGLLKELPDAMDLLTVSVEAGLGFDSALLHVVDKSKGDLAEEFKTTLKELQMGKTRREALRGLGERTNVDDILTFVGAMIQADQLGVPISKILRTQAEQIRVKRRQRVEEKAMKAPIKMLVPLVFFIFPSIFIVLLGPAAIQIYQVMLKNF